MGSGLSRNILDAFNMPFSQAREGSKVIVTTRDPSIGEGMSTARPIHVHSLQFEHYWPLFKKLAFRNKDPEDYPELVPIGEKIAKRLNGLPQAAETFCQALRSDFNADHWRGISKRKMYQMGAEKHGIMATLRLSHEQLPGDLKECFVSCSLFPKGYAFQKEEIIRVWMALGYLDGPGDGVQRMEDIGKSIFTQLLQRSFFEENNKAPGTYIIPEPLDELAEFLSSGEYFRIEKRSESDNGPINIPERARHVYLDINDLERASERLLRITNLRSLVVVGQISPGSKRSDLVKTLQDLLIGMKCLGVLMVSEPLLEKLPELKHLLYLEIHVEGKDGNASLPESICKLYQLQTLIARFCGNKLSMPKDFNQLISLQFLETEPEAVCTIAGIGMLTSLQEINIFEVGDNDKFGLRQLENMDQLRGNLCIKGLEMVENKSVSDKKKHNKGLASKDSEAKLYKKEYIRTLDLRWKSKERNESMMTAHYEVLERLQPHCNLSKLMISGYTGMKPPNWLKGAQAQELNLKCIELSNCSGWEDLPPFGILPYLKVLHLKQMGSLRQIKKEIYGQDISSGFPQLHELLLEDLCNLEEWFLPSRDIQLFPKLHSLSITNCDNLKGPEDLPSLLEKLESVVIKDCPNIPSMTIGEPILKIDVECIRTSMTRPVYCQKPASLKRKVAEKPTRNVRQKSSTSGADIETGEKL
uniref:NB-ARC domain-containing protein n=1 Tax=Hordeum vulgare subsp. vulgare TaxID=112509 RepID=A0A8I7B6Z6_HORVV